MANIALVDDDKNILASVSMLLEQEGYHVRTFSDGGRCPYRADHHPARSCHTGHQDAAHGRAGVGCAPAPRLRPAVIFLTSKDERSTS